MKELSPPRGGSPKRIRSFYVIPERFTEIATFVPSSKPCGTWFQSGLQIRFDQIGCVENEAKLLSQIESLGLKDRLRLRGMLSHRGHAQGHGGCRYFPVEPARHEFADTGKTFRNAALWTTDLAITDRGGATAERSKSSNSGPWCLPRMMKR